MTEVVLPFNEDESPNGKHLAIYRAFLAKSPSNNPTKLVKTAEWGGQTWRLVQDNDVIKFVSQGPVSVFNNEYAGTSVPEERSVERIKEQDMDMFVAEESDTE